MANSTTYRQDQRLKEAITERLDDMTFLFEVIADIASPEDVFDESALEVWASEHGFVQEKDLETWAEEHGFVKEK